MDDPGSRDDRPAPPAHVPAAAGGGGPAPAANHQVPVGLVDLLWFDDEDQLTAPMRAFLADAVVHPIEFPVTELAPAWLQAAVEQQRGRRHAPNEHEGAWRHAERRQAKRQESEAEAIERQAATKASLAFLTAERALSDWRLALLELTRAHASLLIAMILKMLVRISTAPFHQRLLIKDTLKEPLNSAGTDELRLDHVSSLLNEISPNSDQLVGVVEVLDRVLGRVTGVVAKAPRTPCLRLLVRFLQLGLPAFTNTGLGTGFLLHDYLRGAFATVLRKEYDALPSDLPLPPDLVEKFTKSLTPLAADLLAALSAFPADCHFTLAGGATASAHLVILRQRCPLLETQRAHPSVPPAVFDVILKYLYTDCISIASTHDPVLTDVMAYAGTLRLNRLEALAEFLLSSRRTPVPDSTYQHDMQVIMHDRALAPLAETALLIPSSGVPVPVHRFNGELTRADSAIALRVQPKVLDILLAYTYTDVAPFDLALICELYAAADTLLMHDLRDKAVEYLERNMRTEFIVPVCNRAYTMSLSGMAEFCFSYLLANMRTVVQSQRQDFLALQDIVLQAFLAQMFNRQVDEESVRCNDLQMNILRIVIAYVLQGLCTEASRAVPFPARFARLVQFALSDYVSVIDLTMLLAECGVYSEAPLVSVFVSFGVVFGDIDVHEAIELSRVASHKCSYCGAFELSATHRRQYIRILHSDPTSPVEPCPCHARAEAPLPSALCSGCQQAQLLDIADMWYARTMNELRCTIPVPSLAE